MAKKVNETIHDLFDPSLLEDFKSIIDEHDDTLILLYSSFNEKNLWNVICSVKDWLSVSIYGLPYIELDHPQQDARSLNLLQLLSTLDLIVESIKQLYRVFTEQDTYPFSSNNSIFLKDISDDDYFSHLRASFGAHPTNLKSKDGMKQNERRYFASWSSDLGTDEFSVFIYSNKPNEEPFQLRINYSEIFSYANMRYNLLNDVCKLIKIKCKTFEEENKSICIREVEDPIKQLEILKEEHIKRKGDSFGYWYEINTLLDLLSAPLRCSTDGKVYQEYLSTLIPMIKEIFINIQEMNFIDLKNNFRSRSSALSKYSYDIEKIYEYINNPSFKNSERARYHINRLVKDEILPSYTDMNMDRRDLLLILHTYLR